MEECVFCSRPLDAAPTVKLRQKGCVSINKASAERNTPINVKPGQDVHVECRRDFIHKRNMTVTTDSNNNLISTRLTNDFDFKSKCLFCSSYAKFENRKRGLDVFPVRTLEFQKNIRDVCSRRNDNWSREVSDRISQVIDLPAADAVYHQQCSVNFRTLKQIPKKFENCCKSPCRTSLGRPEATDTNESFQTVVEFIKENEGSVVSMSELIRLMTDHCGDRAYSHKHMKTKLIEHFGESICITSSGNTETKITLKRTASAIIDDFSKSIQGMTEADKKSSLISAAAKLIKTDIYALEAESTKAFYPSYSTVSSTSENQGFLPESLQCLLKVLFSGSGSEKRIASIGQAMIQAARPKGIIPPLQVALGIQLHHLFGSRYLLDLLNTLGFCSSYYEVQKFESNAAVTLNTTIPSFFPGKFLQFVADNADHNVRTLDGLGTFHGMGIIACTSPGSSASPSIPRGKVSLSDVTELGKISIKYFKYPDSEITERLYFQDIQFSDMEACDSRFDLFSKIVWPLNIVQPSWSTFMHLFSSTEDVQHPSKSSVTFLPMIDMSPSDISCINTTLHFVADLSKKYDVTPVLTFDQPLFQKATEVMHASEPRSPLKKIVLRLGGFHTEMSFLGTIGYIMSGSGLQDVLQSIYAPNAVTHMLTGKAVSRAIRGHFLVDTALHTLLLNKVYPSAIPSELLEPDSRDGVKNVTDCDNSDKPMRSISDENELKPIGDATDENKDQSDAETCHVKNQNVPDNCSSELTSLVELYGKLENKTISKTDVCEHEDLKNVSQKLEDAKEELRQNRTSVLWFQYMKMIEILQHFIRAERIGDWNGHLKALRMMLPFFAASGHYLYLKSVYVYLQKMMTLQTEHPDIHQHFMQGNHTVRRTDKYWGGLSTDLMIEQVLMRSLKTTGGLTRGRGITESQRALWLMSMPACAEMNHAMQEFSDTIHAGSEQHKESSQSRRKRDHEDVKKILQFLQNRSPYNAEDPSLRNIVTGVTADEKANVDRAVDIGNKIVNNMKGHSVEEYVYKRKCQAVQLSDTGSVKINNEIVSIDPQLLFQRLITVANRCEEDIAHTFKYELCSYPSSLFDSTGLPRAPQKSQLADAIWKLVDGTTHQEVDSDQRMYVIDGGSLLQKIPWQKDGTFGSICDQYYQYLFQKYSNTTVVFDGYKNGPSTKDITHVRRNNGNVGTPVRFTLETPFRSSKESFLKNSENKQSFIILLGTYLEERNITVKYAESDADGLIVQTALQYAETQTTYVIGEDTDILVLLCFHAQNESKVFFRSDTRQSKVKPNRVWDITKTQAKLTMSVCECLLFLHAFTGCDTTSRVYGIGKATALKLLRHNIEFQDVCKCFITSASKEEVIQHGERAMIMLIGGGSTGNLDTLRFQRFNAKVTANTTCVQVHTLPPTSAATVFHSLRVYLQCQVWIGNTSLQADEWGWQMKNGMYVPIKTNLPAAPEQILNVVRCNCKTNCDSKRCTCRKNGLECSYSCGTCRGISCTNSIQIDESVDDMTIYTEKS